MNAQKSADSKAKKKNNNKPEVEEEGPLVFKFDPDYEAAKEERLAELKRRKAIIDTMNISDRKRRKLLQDLYRTKGSKRLTAAKITDTKSTNAKN